jgi:HD-like signal output (HDOD) protein/CheY-like chemotaxis protein
MKKKRILFVDDEPNILKSFQRMLRDMREEWDMIFVSSAKEAIDTLGTEYFDVIVSDVLMPDMNGLELLNRVMKAYPKIIRIILSGHFDEDMTMGSIRLAHQSLHKPCSLDDLKSTIQRALRLQDELEGDELKEIVARMDRLPSLPILYDKIIKTLNSPDASMRKVGEIISMDMGMTAKVLQLVNSAYFGLRRHINTPAEAVVYLGLEQIKALVLSVHIFSQAELQGFSQKFLKDLWDHCFLTGMYAKTICQAMHLDKSEHDIAFTAGVLHDVGKLIFIANYLDEYMRVVDRVKGEHVLFGEAEKDQFRATHSEVGAYLLGIWGLPDKIVESVMFHHNPRGSTGEGFSPLTAVHIGNYFSGKKVFAGQGMKAVLDMEYLERLKVANRITEWELACMRLGDGKAAAGLDF